MSSTTTETLDITPEPRVLRMLGQVDLSPSRCFAEFIDNALDEGIKGTPGTPDSEVQGSDLSINIKTPTITEFDDNPISAEVIVSDTGPGMSTGELERNLRAGYSGKDPTADMGLFGMGFNIATARLGDRTTVRTTTTGDEYWSVAVIDFDLLQQEGKFEIDVTFEEKTAPGIHGTEVRISKLNEFARTLHRKQKLSEKLGDWYSTVLDKNDVEIILHGGEITPKSPCRWSDERSVEKDGEEIPTYIPINDKVGEDFYCKNCWEWQEGEYLESIDEEDPKCHFCDAGGDVVQREKRVTGWVGIQRFFDDDDFGIDIIRNGRIIEKHDKSLFYCENPKGEMEKEYPLDATYWGGRIIGELHIDFVRVTNTKDAFERSDPNWDLVRDKVRGGDMPVRPQVATRRGYEGTNTSPIAKLYKGYRYGKPPGKKHLVPGEVQEDGSVDGDNSRPKAWAKKFWEDEEEFQDDSKWWELVVEAERAQRETSSPESGNGSSETDVDLDPGSSGGDDSSGTDGSGSDDEGDEEEWTIENIEASHDSNSSGSYGLDNLGEPDIDFSVYSVEEGDLPIGPVYLRRDSWKERTIYYKPQHPLFKEFDFEPIDVILIETSRIYYERLDDPGEWDQPSLFSELQTEYCDDRRVNPEGLALRSEERLREIKELIAEQDFDLGSYNVSDEQQKRIRKNVLRDEGKGEDVVEDLLDSSAYLKYASHEELRRYFIAHPEQFFDGNVWERAYDNVADPDLKEDCVEKFTSYLDDVIMLAEEAIDISPDKTRPARRIEIDRGADSLRLLGVEQTEN